MESLHWILGCDKIKYHIWQKILDAKKSVYISVSTNKIDWNCRESETNLTFLELLWQVCTARAVYTEGNVSTDGPSTPRSRGRHSNFKIFILFQEGIIDNIGSIDSLPKLPVQCCVRIVPNFGPTIAENLLPLTKTVENIFNEYKDDDLVINFRNLTNKRIYKHNQCYLLVDESELMMGDIIFNDVNDANDASTSNNSNNYAIACLGRGNKNFFEFALSNWDNIGNSPLLDKFEAKDGILNAEKQYQYMCHCIDYAKDYVYIETAHLISYAETKNDIIQRLTKRLIKSHNASVSVSAQENDNFKCVILVNNTSTTSTPFETKEDIMRKLNYTLEYIIIEIKKAEIDPNMLTDRLFIGFLNNFDNSNEKIIRSLIFIQDGDLAFLSNSSITDRSLNNQDRELSHLISDRTIIQNLEHLIWNSHLPNFYENENIISFDQFFDACIEIEMEIMANTIDNKSEKNAKSDSDDESRNRKFYVRKHRMWKNVEDVSNFKISNNILRLLIGQNYFL